ncbi:MlaE family lipid ABC transporter permease subunit [Zavarzinia sp. CC-PAN008]|uniref:ABC transporter permease n=1 Tax=Zavarzinia sp. CC-PAN008 TaxID=3243332 RepID=UPI003F749922
MLHAAGDWTFSTVGLLDPDLDALKPGRGEQLHFDISGIQRLDTAGAWLIHRTLARWGQGAALSGESDASRVLLEQVEASTAQGGQKPPRTENTLVEVVLRVGRTMANAGTNGRDLVAFLGLVLASLFNVLRDPRRLRVTSIVAQMEQVGLNAVPIVALISFLIGIVLAYQGADQLRRFGADVFVVNLVTISTLREIGILLAAIVVAGRSGSAFTAQIGSMKLNEEVDAIRTLGLDPVELLVLPRLIALLIMMPGLAFLADLAGLLGGGLMCWLALGIPPAAFIERVANAADFWTVMVGLIKAPFFGAVIALIGCFEGLKVEASAESLGAQTTKSVVEGIFLVLVLDAFFSIFFAQIGI